MPVGDTSPAWNIAQILKAHASPNIDAAPWIITVDKMPADPDTVITVKDSSGPAAEPAVAIDYPGVQILVRGSQAGDGYAQAYDKIFAVRNALVGIPSRPSIWTALASCVQRGHIVPLGEQDTDRPVLSLNLQLIVWYTSMGYREALP